MQRRFILASMAAFALVMGVLVVGINFVNYMRITAYTDMVLDYIRDNHRESDPQPEFTKGFFVVQCDEEGSVSRFDLDHISSIDEQEAEEYAKDILKQNRLRGYYKDYRYRVEKPDSGYEIIFLNVANSMGFHRILTRVSIVIGCVSFAVVSVLVVLFSGNAVRPYVISLEKQKQFITDAGHELKTPLASIVISADILAEECEENEWLENIRNQASRMSGLVSDLVILSRLDEDMPLPDVAMFSLTEVAWEISKNISALAKAKGKVFEQKIEENLNMSGDRGMILRLLSILLENAVNYSDEEGRISMSIYRRHGKIYIEVYNTCELEDDSDVERWFDRFYRPDRSHSAHMGGSGLGLSMARAIAEVHGGEISVKCQNGKEITFKVVL